MSDDHPSATKRLGDTKDVCQILGCGPTHLWKLAKEGLITPVRISSRMTRYDLAEVNALADGLIADAKAKAAARRANKSGALARPAA